MGGNNRMGRMNNSVVFDRRLKKSGSQYRDPRTGRFVSDPGKPITFRCRFCGKDKPLDEMRTLTRFMPPLVACRECEKRMR